MVKGIKRTLRCIKKIVRLLKAGPKSIINVGTQQAKPPRRPVNIPKRLLFPNGQGLGCL